MDRGVWRATVHGVTESWTRLNRLSVQTAHRGDPGVSQDQTQPVRPPPPPLLTCSKAGLSQLVRKAAVMLVVVGRGQLPARPLGTPALPLDEVGHAATGHGRGLCDVVPDALHHS